MSFISFRNHYFIIQINSNELKGKLKRKMNEHNRNLRLPLQLAARKNTSLFSRFRPAVFSFETFGRASRAAPQRPVTETQS